MEKRSVSIAGHRTSIALEPEFWQALDAMADARGLSMAGLVREIDETRTVTNLSSALRLAALGWYRDSSAVSEADRVAEEPHSRRAETQD